MKKFLINTFALIGFVTFILLACSVDEIADSSDNNNNNSETVSNDYGKYQMTAGGTYQVFHVLNTETGEVRSYLNEEQRDSNGNWDGSFNLKHTTQTF